MMIKFRPLNDALGAEVLDINLAADHSDETIRKIREGWLQYGILLFRGQELTIEHQSAFAQRFGTFKSSPQSRAPQNPEHPEVICFSNIKVDGKDIGGRPDRAMGDAWHSDFSFLKEPAGGSLFYAKEVPEKGGDDTWYANLNMAYDALSDDTKAKLENLRWEYSHVSTFERHVPDKPMTEEQKRNLPDVSHPFVRTHPETGRKALFVGILDTREASVHGMSKEEGVKFIEELKSFATQPKFTYKHQWQQGDSILWDNRCMLHRGSIFPDSNGRRLCYRVTLEGGVPY